MSMADVYEYFKSRIYIDEIRKNSKKEEIEEKLKRYDMLNNMIKYNLGLESFSKEKLEEMLDYFISIERYETCEHLVKEIKKLK